MLNRQLFLVVLVCLLLLSALSGWASPPPVQAKWTVMFFVAGDSNLEGLAVDEFESEFCRNGSSDQVQVVVLFDRSSQYDKKCGDWTGTLIFHCQAGMTAAAENAVENWGERSTGDPQTLADFVTWGKTHYPAEQYALILWGHSWTWEPGYTMRDETDADTLEPDEIDQAMQAAGPVDLVAHDSCGAQVIETAAMWRHHASVMVGQQFYSWWESFKFDQALAALLAKPSISAEELGKVLAGTVKQFGASAIALDARFDQLLAAAADWSSALLAGLPAYRSAYDAAWHRTQYFGTKDRTTKTCTTRHSRSIRRLTIRPFGLPEKQSWPLSNKWC